MKLIIALLFFVNLTVVTIHLAVIKRIDSKLTTLFLFCAIVGGFAIANYDVIRYFKLGREGVEIETAKREIDDAKSSALAEIDAEVKSQKESIRLLVSNANQASDKLEAQKEALSKLVDTAIALQKNIEQQKREISKLNQETLTAKQEIVKLNTASSEIALTLVRATYLTLQTRSEFGAGPRLTKAVAEIEKDINQILPMVIPNPQLRAEWLQQLQNTLPKRE